MLRYRPALATLSHKGRGEVSKPRASASPDPIVKQPSIIAPILERRQTGTEPATNRGAFNLWISKIVDYQGFSPDVASHWTRTFSRELRPNDPAAFTLSAKPPELQEISHLSIISRAALLLRVSTGCTAQLLQASGFTMKSVEFWWNGLGQARGIWEGAKDNEDLTDLWADKEPLLRDVEGFQNKYTHAEQTFFRLGNELGNVMTGLGSCERVAIWGMTP